LRCKSLLHLEIIVVSGKRHQKLQLLHCLNDTPSIGGAYCFAQAVI
jgi:hypothetical protein